MSAVAHEVRLKRAMRGIEARFARDTEGGMIAQMVHTCHEGVPNVTWERVKPFWLVVEHEQEPVGCLNVVYSVPIGRLEWMSFVPGLPFKVRALSVKALLSYGEKVLKETGSKAAVGNISFEQKSFRDILEAEGCGRLMSGATMGRVIP